uniref:Uncharacterized protein n=2 Tax=Trichuris muris TaxID=70415 RepID=A0A5S6PZ80_TRIMR
MRQGKTSVRAKQKNIQTPHLGFAPAPARQYNDALSLVEHGYRMGRQEIFVSSYALIALDCALCASNGRKLCIIYCAQTCASLGGQTPQFRVWRPLTYGQRKARLAGNAAAAVVTLVFCGLGVLSYQFAFPTPAMRYNKLQKSYNIDTSENLYLEDKTKKRLRMFGSVYEEMEDMRAGGSDVLNPVKVL